jgi:L-lactate dehydrogenase complex protein LldE
MRIGLFIPCYTDAFFPEVGIATLELLERFGHEAVYRTIRPVADSR